MAKIIAISDTHIPSRASELPEWFFSTVEKEKPHIIFHLGDITSEDVYYQLIDFSKSMDVSFYAVRGNMDYIDIPMSNCIKGLRLNVCGLHGSGIYPRGDKASLFSVAEHLNAHILLNGHTHIFSTYLFKGRLFVNPGSLTGVWGGSSDGGEQTLAVINLKEDNVIVEKVVYGEKRDIYTFSI